MIIKYFADIRSLTGRNEEQWLKAATTVRQLLAGLSARYGAAFEDRVFKGGRLSDTVILLVNGKDVRHLNAVDTRLSPEDVVVLFPMVAGG